MPNSEAPDAVRPYAQQGYRICPVEPLPLDEAWPGKLPASRQQPVHARSDGSAASHAAQAALAHATRVATLAEMSATIAHEVNQPLAAIVMGAETGLRWLARDEPDMAKVEQLLRRIVSSARRASDMVQRIRGMATRHEPALGPVDLNEVVEEALQFVQPELEARSIDLEVMPGADLPLVLGDRIQLQQVIVNLLVNSIQAVTQTDGPARWITLDTGADESDAVGLSVRDSGPGVPGENIDRVFDSFFTTKEDGMGIGLAICRSIVMAHGGSISVSNLPGGGAEFRVVLPAIDSAGKEDRP